MRRVSSQRKFKILSFSEEPSLSYPSVPLVRQSKGISFGVHRDSEIHFPSACNHERPTFVEYDRGDLHTTEYQ